MKIILPAIACAALLGLGTAASAHARLASSEPGAGSTGPAPSTLKLHYNEAVEVAMSAVRLVGPDGAAVAVGKPAAVPGDDRTIVTTVPALAAGAYRLEWSTMGHDGHHTKGELRFTVK